jgi:tight adherence protein C
MFTAPFVVSLLVFGATMLFVLAYLAHMGSMRGHRTLVDKIKDTTGGLTVEEDITAGVSSSGSRPKDQLLAVMARIGSFANFAKPKGEEGVSHVQKLFLKAGYRDKNAAVIFFGSKVLCAAILFVCIFALQVLKPGQVKVLNLSIFSIGFAVFGFYLPNLWLSFKVTNRKEALSLGLPDALDLLVVCAEAGMGLDAAIKRVGEEMKLSNKAISDEFKLLNLEMRAGKARKSALKNLAMRTDLEEINSLITLLIQTDKFGTSVAQALRVQSDAMRLRRTQHVEEVAAKLPIKLLFPTIFCIFPSLFLVILGPAIIQALKILNN